MKTACFRTASVALQGKKKAGNCRGEEKVAGGARTTIKRVANGVRRVALSPYMGQSYGLSPKLSYLCWRESTQRFSAQSKDCLLDARYLLCVISLVLAGFPPLSHRQVAFVNFIAIMELSALPRRLLGHRVSCIPVWRALLEDLNLPSISDLLANQRAHNSWKLATKRLLTIHSNLSLSVDCPLLPIGLCNLPLGKPAPHWALTLTNTKKTRNNNFHICLLTGCDGLEAV